MFKQKIILFIVFGFLFICPRIFSQIVATPTSGCFPQTIGFLSPPGATSASWNFGDLGTSVLLNPSHNYLIAGNFTVVCNYSVGATPFTATLVVPVFAKPTAAFNFNLAPIGCAPRTATFNNTSNGPAPITSYTWNFGNGALSNVASPVYPYPASGSFNINLTVMDANGCTGTVSAGPINVSNPPIVIINTNPSPASGCTVPFVCNFNGANSISGSPIPGALTYNWIFSGGLPGSSGAATPGNITYNAIGNYNTTLTVTDNNNCSNVATVPVNVSQPTLLVTGATTACVNSIYSATVQSNSNTSINGPFVNNASVLPLVTYTWTYGSPGTFTYAVTAGFNPCTASQIKTVVVTQVTAAITATPPSFSCASPFINQYFNASSPNAVSYFWSVTNCNNTTFTSNATNPTFTFTQGSLNPYTIYPYCIPLVTLIASSANGCTAVATIAPDTLRRPTAWFNKNKKEGCAPLIVTYRDTSFAHPSPTVITSYTWNNGASPPTLSMGISPPIPNATFTYAAPGTYTPFLIIQTAQGCIDTSFVDTVIVVNPAPISFSFSPNVVCPGQTVQITATTTAPPIQHWHVNSDVGFFSGCVSNPNPAWVFTHIGVHTFTLSAWKNSCQSTTTIPQTVTVKGPIVQSRFTTDCNNRYTVFFNSHLQDAANGTINFGDGNFVTFPAALGASFQHTINHTYANTGNYTVVVTATNGITGTCTPQTYTMLVQVRDIQGAITSPSTTCWNVSNVFSSATSTDVLVGCPNIGYTWFFDNAPPIVTSLTAVSYSWATPGSHTVVLLVKDLNSCSNTVTTTIRVSKPDPQFTPAPSATICLSAGTVTFNNSTPQVPDAIAGYTWNFGNGLTSNSTGSPSTNYTSAAIPFSIYTVTLTVTNTLGCVDSKTLNIQVNNPNAGLFASPGQSICVGVPVSISAPPGYASYTLNLGDGSSVGTYSTSHSYTAPGVYTASVNIVDAGGCKSSSTLNFYVDAFPIANFTVFSAGAQLPNVACKGDVLFTSTSTYNPIGNVTYSWNTGNGANILPIPSVIATYTGSGAFPVTLTVTSPNGCKSVITKTITIVSATANLVADKTTICLGQAINFTVNTNAWSWTWDFADGNTDTIYAPTSPAISHTYNLPPGINGNATVSVVYFSTSFGCKFPAVSIPIKVIIADADFLRNVTDTLLADTVHCLGKTDFFKNQILNPNDYTFNWNFGNNNITNLQNPSYTYSLAGVYHVSLTVTDIVNGCIGIKSKFIIVNPLPTALINLRDTCQNSLFPLLGSGIGNSPFTSTWTPSLGVTNPNALITTATATGSTVYTLTVRDINGCDGVATKSVYIQQPPKNIQWDTTIIIGQIVPLNGYAGTNMSYTWNPAKDLNCTNCVFPITTSTDNITYTVTVKDNMGCFSAENTYTVRVDPRATIDVPTAFTPNGDGTNDVIYVDGWGIKKLNYFRIYNRWGQLLFESNDIKIGWNGLYNSVPQNMETYVYQVSAETFVDKEPQLKTGSFKLIR